MTNDSLDTDRNGICNISDPDDDADTITDELDNCPVTPNEDQADSVVLAVPVKMQVGFVCQFPQGRAWS